MKKVLWFSVITLIACCASAHAGALSLKDCLKSAAENNPSLKVIDYNSKIASDDIDIAKSAYMPRVDAHAAYTGQDVAQSIKLGPSRLDLTDQDFPSAGVSVTQTIYDFGRTASRKKKAEDTRDASEQTYKAREQDVFMKVVEAYYGILEAGKILKASDDEVIQMENHLRVAKALFEQGVATRNDVLQAEVQVANSRQRRLSAVNRVENRWLALNFLTGNKESERPELVEESDNGTSGLPASERADFSKHPEIKAILMMIDASKNGVEEARSYYKPEIFGKLQADYLRNSQVEEDSILSATIGMKMNLFDGYATTSRCEQSVKQQMKAKEALIETEKRLKLEYETAVNDSQVAEKRIEAISKAIALGEENLRINKNKYQEQVGTATNVLDAQTLLTQTRTEYYRAVFDKEIALARIRKATGDL